MAAPPGSRDLPRIVLGVLFILLVGGGSLYILKPFLPAIIWATMIVVATWPLLTMLQARLGGSRALAATTIMVLLLVIVIAPLVMLITSIVGQAEHLSELRDLEITLPGPPAWVASIPMVGDKVAAEWTAIVAGGPSRSPDGCRRTCRRSAPGSSPSSAGWAA
jgi:predicted PurR-regulated permease PerM